MNAMKTMTNDFKVIKTKNDKLLLKVFNRDRFEIIIFTVDNQLASIIQDYAELSFTYVVNYNKGIAWGNLLAVVAPDGDVIYNALSI